MNLVPQGAERPHRLQTSTGAEGASSQAESIQWEQATDELGPRGTRCNRYRNEIFLAKLWVMGTFWLRIVDEMCTLEKQDGANSF